MIYDSQIVDTKGESFDRTRWMDSGAGSMMIGRATTTRTRMKVKVTVVAGRSAIAAMGQKTGNEGVNPCDACRAHRR